MGYTLGQAAKATGKSKATISRAIKNGRLFAIKDNSGAFNIDPKELHELYPLPGATVAATVDATPKMEHDATPLVIENSTLKVELNAAREQIDGLKADKDYLQKALTDALADRAGGSPRRGLLSRIFGKD